MKLRTSVHIGLLSCISVATALAAREPIPPIVNDPYTSYIVVDGNSGAVISEQNADTRIYPASIIKLMDLLLVLERIDDGRLSLDEWVHVTPKAARMGGSQVYLKEGEMFSVEDMLYALSIKSANDVAMALALHIGGTEAEFVRMMNQRAAELGMTNTVFHSVHGLPPEAGDKPDISTARDLATLSLEIVKHPQALVYTSTIERWFRDNTFQLLTHNRLLRDVPGCDGFKTGYFRAAGFSISASALRNGRRVIAVVAGCKSRQTRDAKARELLAYGFAHLPQQQAPAPPHATMEPTTPDAAPTPDAPRPSLLGKAGRTLTMIGKIILAVVGVLVVIGLIRQAISSRRRDRWKI